MVADNLGVGQFGRVAAWSVAAGPNLVLLPLRLLRYDVPFGKPVAEPSSDAIQVR
jgi:hypothetical protein